MNNEISLPQGDRTNNYRILAPTGYPDISDPSWIGEYTIRERNITGAIEQQGFVGKDVNGGSFLFFLDADMSATLSVGTKFLTVEIRNMDITPSFRREPIRSVLKITDSGVPNV